jgi:tetratricopeptide (TPR) repeat protein
MRAHLRSWFVVLTLLAAFPATAAADKPAAPVEIIYLNTRESKTITDADEPAPILARELMRQAFLIAARDEWGLLTRDSTLRETDPGASAHAAAFDFYCKHHRIKKERYVDFTLSRSNGKALEKLGDWTFRTDIYNPKIITDLADLAERMSRGKFKNLLKEQGLGKSVPAPREFAGVPRETRERLWEWNEMTVLGALRRIHAEIRTKGESPELLAGLAVGYANLGSLTDSYVSPTSKVFYARALVYAQRLVHKSDESDWALWHRAYVRVLVGLHNAARLDVKAARKAWNKASSKQPPFWANILEAFCDGHLPQMLEKAKTHDEQRLARYLNMQAVMYSGINTITIRACLAFLQECPDCVCAADALCGTREIGTMQMTTESAFTLLSSALRRRLPDVYGFPASLAKRVTDAKPVRETVGEQGKEDEIDFRAQLVDDIKAETTSGHDTLEPSLDVLGNFIEETQFLQAIGRLELEHHIWAVPTEQTVATYRPLCTHHPLGSFLASYSNDPGELTKTYNTIIAKLQTSDLTLNHWLILNTLRLRSLEPGTTWLRIAWAHADPIWGDEMGGLGTGIGGQPDDRESTHYMDMTWKTSSRLPSALAIQLDRNWARGRTFMATVENDSGDDPILMAALSRRYYKLKQWDNAERCGKKWLAAAPDYANHRLLAAIYKEKGDLVHWKETLVKSLDIPSAGLAQAQVQDELAHYHMNRKEWSEAVVFADGAAESYSGWGMMTACRCHEMLGQWEKAEAFVRAVSERYDNSRFEWMQWCHRTGHGDADAADNCARTYFESLGTNIVPYVRQQIAVYYVLRDEPAKAQTVFEMCFNKEHEAYNGLHAALIADALGKTADRDRLLTEIVDANPGLSPRGAAYAGIYKDLVEQLQKGLPPGSVKDLEFTKIEAVIFKSPDTEAPTNLEYFVGMFLKNRGDKEKSREYLIRAAQSDLTVKYNHVFARQTLRDLKIPLPPPKAVAQSSKPKK